MAQSSAQRDPSMEEILASIRKIIEEGEETRQKPAESRDEFEPVSIGPAANDASPRLSTAPELRKEVPVVEMVEPDVFARMPVEQDTASFVSSSDENALDIGEAEEDFSLSLDDFMNEVEEMRIREDAARSSPQPEVNAKADDSENAEQLEQTAQLGISHVDAATLHRSESTAENETSKLAVDTKDRQGTLDSGGAVVSQPQSENASESAFPAPSAISRSEIKPSIVSQLVERQVAASFTELSEALAVSRRRPLDQIAEEMMRPMLQEWLDNNLPTLVERLVREEIERVARGAA